MGVLITTPAPLYCDNKSAIHIARNSFFHEGTKNIEIDSHITRYAMLRDMNCIAFYMFHHVVG